MKTSAKKFRLVVGPSSGISSQKPSLLVSSLKKNKNPKPKFFSLPTPKPAKSFEGLNSSQAQSAEELHG